MVAGADRDLALLAGDYLYALGLERLAALGDLDAVRELSDLISLAAQVHDGSRAAERGRARGDRALAGVRDGDRRRAGDRARARQGRAARRAPRRAAERSGRRGDARPPRRPGSGTPLERGADAIDFRADHLS